MHNVLHGIAPDSIQLTDDEKAIYETWCETNVQRDWANGPFKDSHVIVVDDPQRKLGFTRRI
jgi:hypothetical protein